MSHTYTDRLIAAFHAYLNRPRRPPPQSQPTAPGKWRESTVHSIAWGYCVHPQHLQGALLLNRHIPPPARRQPVQPKDTFPRPIGRPKVPVNPEQRTDLERFIQTAGRGSAKLAAHLLGMSPKTLGQKLKGASGLTPDQCDLMREAEEGT